MILHPTLKTVAYGREIVPERHDLPVSEVIDLIKAGHYIFSDPTDNFDHLTRTPDTDVGPNSLMDWSPDHPAPKAELVIYENEAEILKWINPHRLAKLKGQTPGVKKFTPGTDATATENKSILAKANEDIATVLEAYSTSRTENSRPYSIVHKDRISDRTKLPAGNIKNELVGGVEVAIASMDQWILCARYEKDDTVYLLARNKDVFFTTSPLRRGGIELAEAFFMTHKDGLISSFPASISLRLEVGSLFPGLPLSYMAGADPLQEAFDQLGLDSVEKKERARAMATLFETSTNLPEERLFEAAGKTRLISDPLDAGAWAELSARTMLVNTNGRGEKVGVAGANFGTLSGKITPPKEGEVATFVRLAKKDDTDVTLPGLRFVDRVKNRPMSTL